MREFFSVFILSLMLFIPGIVFGECFLSWDAPTQDTSGDALVPGDIDAYRVYVLPRGQNFVKGQHTLEVLPVSTSVDPVTSVRCSSLGFSGLKKATVTAVGTGGESDFSNVVVLRIPNPPKNTDKEER